MKTVLVIGSGGRCHAIVEQLSQSPQVGKIFAAPGNAGIAQKAECLAIGDTEIEKLLAFAKNNAVDLTVVGPEVPLSMGIADKFAAVGLRIFGCTQAAARIESSKEFAKDLMKRYGIPTAAYEVFSDYTAALAYTQKQPLPVVLKYDGLAAGKGVVVAATRNEVQAALQAMLQDRKFGAGRVVVEEFLDGVEFSFMCFVNGSKVFPMELAQDHKRAYDGDKGPNTGGMGAYSPLPFITEADFNFALTQVMQKTAQALVSEGCPFCGVLYGGLIKTAQGIKVIEFNARFGDPETEVVLPRLTSDLYAIFNDVMDGKTPLITWSKQVALGVVLASKGYPDAYKKGIAINGLDKVNAQVFHMGTRRDGAQLLTHGGRVLLLTVLADTVAQAQNKILEEVQKIDCAHLFYRKDIGWQAV
ncbi:phosphoribosylamine--glycine ligase [Bacteroidia bacterium]|nr:phosphoribosylamine--glycine ligase [Bacteroidia bacterium]